MSRFGEVSAARRRGAQVHSTRAHYCGCGFIGFGNGAEWSHERKHMNLGIGPARWLTYSAGEELRRERIERGLA